MHAMSVMRRNNSAEKSNAIQGVSKNCQNSAHTKPLFWKHLLDLVDIYL